ncbi:ribosomal-protein-alanine N-acetyltransferase [Alginatibacterium sediminis]|uniref:[Ribosomal protein bS18]-alanine N-acetyltransferase n=1 Tax=Alginatibacterium sediminis TaxID=2164068 RepID=A0A420ECR9_9ALTE|nr:ribosomal protein S18-alanine N-acetyltransferase [Alginatibacterium sediminis]RKF18480.1 ribosomal-protein-alanine N-acetyltransferase [Alginatibacterium sediminis]
MSSDLSISPLQALDIDAIMAIEAKAHLNPWSRSLMRSNFGGLYCNFGLFDGKQLRGYCILRVVASEAELINIAVDPTFQGQGFGRQLMQYLIDNARTNNWSQIDLEVRLSNKSAQNLYQGFGFSLIGKRENYYPAAQGREDALLYQRYLEA